MKKSVGRERWTAHHEAGHTVGYLALGYQFNAVTVIPDNDTLGKVYPLENYQIRPCDSAIISMCGPIAEAKLRRRAPVICGYCGEHESVCQMADVWGRVHPMATRQEILMDFENRAREIVRDNWRDVVVIACMLIERKTLTYEEVKGLVK